MLIKMYKENCLIDRCHYSPRAGSTKTYVMKHKNNNLFYGKVEVGESNDPCLPEVKWCISKKLIPPVVEEG